MISRKFLVPLGLVFAVFFVVRKNLEASLTTAEANVVKSSAFENSREHTQSLKNKLESGKKNAKDLSNQNPDQKATNPLSPEQLYCQIKSLNLDIPLEGEVKIIAFPYEQDENGDSGTMAWISSSQCPADSYSKIRLDSAGRPLEALGCEKMTKEELGTRSRIQGDVKDASPEPYKINLAISGEGLFVADCDGILSYVRSGRFEIAADGTIETPSACTVLDEEGEPFSASSEADLDQQGWTHEGRCIAVATPAAQDVVYDGEKLLAVSSPQDFIFKKKYLLKNAYEDLSSELHPLATDFAALPALDLKTACGSHNRSQVQP